MLCVRDRKKAKTYEKAEDPLYALENGIPIDTNYYLENQLRKPLTRIFEPILGEGKVESLFKGDHTRKVKKVSSKKAGGLMAFTVKQQKCLGCRCVLRKKDKGKAVCSSCEPRQNVIYLSRVGMVRKKEAEYHMLWTQCQVCQGSNTQRVIFSNTDCPIFYRRTKTKIDLESAIEELAQFKL